MGIIAVHSKVHIKDMGSLAVSVETTIGESPLSFNQKSLEEELLKFIIANSNSQYDGLDLFFRAIGFSKNGPIRGQETLIALVNNSPRLHFIEVSTPKSTTQEQATNASVENEYKEVVNEEYKVSLSEEKFVTLTIEFDSKNHSGKAEISYPPYFGKLFELPLINFTIDSHFMLDGNVIYIYMLPLLIGGEQAKIKFSLAGGEDGPFESTFSVDTSNEFPAYLAKITFKF